MGNTLQRAEKGLNLKCLHLEKKISIVQWWLFSSVFLPLYSSVSVSFFSPFYISLQWNEGFFLQSLYHLFTVKWGILHPFNISSQLNEGFFVLGFYHLSTIEWGILSSSLYSSVSDSFIRNFIFSLLFSDQKKPGQFCLPGTRVVVIRKKEYTGTQKPRQWSGDVTADVCVWQSPVRVFSLEILTLLLTQPERQLQGRIIIKIL